MGFCFAFETVKISRVRVSYYYGGTRQNCSANSFVNVEECEKELNDMVNMMMMMKEREMEGDFLCIMLCIMQW